MNREIKYIYVIIALGIFLVIINVVNQYNLIPGNWNIINTNFLNVFPYLMIIFIAIYWLMKR